MGSASGTDADAATRVVVSYDPGAVDEQLHDWVGAELGRERYAAYLRRARGTAREGETWEEFVSRGCGRPVDVVLRVERVEGGRALCPDTTIEVRARD